MANYPHKHLEITQTPMAALAINAIGHLTVMSKGNRWALKGTCLHISYVFAVTRKTKSAENVVQAYLSGILAHK